MKSYVHIVAGRLHQVFLNDETAANIRRTRDDVIIPVKLVTAIALPMAAEPHGEQEALPMRREPNGGFTVTPRSDDNHDYAEAMAKLESAVAHLREALPNGQLLRTRFAMQQLYNGMAEMTEFLGVRDVL